MGTYKKERSAELAAGQVEDGQAMRKWREPFDAKQSRKWYERPFYPKNFAINSPD